MPWRMGRAVAVFLLVLTGCAGRGPILAPVIPETAEKSNLELDAVPFFPQEEYQCGPASLATVLTHAGVDIDPESLVPLVYIPEKQGSLQVEMISASRRYHRIPYVITPEIGALAAELQAGRPVLVMQNLGFEKFPVWHYAVVIGYSADADELILRSGTNEREVMPGWRFADTWKKARNWGLVVLRPGELPEDPDRDRYLAAVAAMESVASPQALLDAYGAALRRWPESSVARFGTAVALHGRGDVEDAEATYRDLLADFPRHPAALNNLAEILADRGCFGEAVDRIDTALEIDEPSLRPALLETRKTILERKGRTGSEPGNCRRPE